MRPPESLELPGLTLLRPVGSGSFGEVWLARSVTGQFRAVKIVWLRRSGDASTNTELAELGERAFRGVRQYLERIPPGSPAGLAVLHVDRDPTGRFFYYVMELADDAVTGRDIHPETYIPLTLSELRRRSPGGVLPSDQVVELGIKIAEQLARLHDAGLVHRDIKPGNIIFVRGEARLADIDLVRPSEASLSLGGTPGFIPPEGPGRVPGDVFSLGRTLYSVLTGFPGSEFPTLPQNWDRRPDAALVVELNRVILRACQPRPRWRYADCHRLHEDLVSLKRQKNPARHRRQRRLGRAGLVLVSLAILAAPLRLAVNQLLDWRLDRDELVDYRDLLIRAVNRRKLGYVGDTRALLNRTATNSFRNVEWNWLDRQSTGSRRAGMLTVDSGVRDLRFSPTATQLGVFTESRTVVVFPVNKWNEPWAIRDVEQFAGFLGDQVLTTERSLNPAGSDSQPQHWIREWRATRLGPRASYNHHSPGGWRLPRIEGSPAFVTLAAEDPPVRIHHWNTKASSSGLQLGTPLPANPLPAGCRVIQVLQSGASSLVTVWKQDGQATSTVFFLQGGSHALRELCTLENRKIEQVAYNSRADSFCFWDPSTGELDLVPVKASKTPEAWSRTKIPRVLSLQFSPDGSRIASGDIDKLVHIRSTPDLKILASLEGHGAVVTALGWEPGGRFAYSGDAEGTILAWDTDNPRRDRNPTVAENFPIGLGARWLVGGGEGRLVAAGIGPDSTAVLDLQTMRVLKRISGLRIPLRFAPFDRRIWGITAEGLLTEYDWERETCTASTSLLSSRQKPELAVCTPDGRWVAVSDGTTLEVFRLHTAEDGTPRSERRVSLREVNPSDILLSIPQDDAGFIVVLRGTDDPLVIDLPSGVSRPIPNPSKTRFTAGCMIPDGSSCLLLDDSGNGVQVNLRKPAQPRSVSLRVECTSNLVVAPAGDRLFAGGLEGQAISTTPTLSIAPMLVPNLELRGMQGEHTVRRICYLPQSQTLVGLTEDGLLVKW